MLGRADRLAMPSSMAAFDGTLRVDGVSGRPALFRAGHRGQLSCLVRRAGHCDAPCGPVSRTTTHRFWLADTDIDAVLTKAWIWHIHGHRHGHGHMKRVADAMGILGSQNSAVGVDPRIV
jgi:hypothetical protein